MTQKPLNAKGLEDIRGRVENDYFILPRPIAVKDVESLLALVDELKGAAEETVEKAAILGRNEDPIGVRWESFWNSMRRLDALLTRLKGENHEAK